MVGHIYKDFKLSTVPLLCMGFFALFLVILAAGFDMDGDMELQEQIMLLVWGLMVFNFIIPMLSMFVVADADEKEKWTQYALCLPGGVRGYVKSKYMFVAIIMTLAAMFTHIYCAVFDGVHNELLLMGSDYIVVLIADGLGMLVCAFYFPFIFRFGQEKGNALGTGVILLGIAGLYLYLMFGDLSMFENNENLAESVISWFQEHRYLIHFVISALFFAGAAAMYGSYRLLVHLFEKGVVNRE